ncbi:MAG: FixH family protein [Natrialbaceae archaeon]|nr:FixH family protein [Natrialbaceae archaeon]
MKSHILLCLLLAGAALLVTPVAAHESETIEGYELTFGGADEPVITDERMWLQLSIENESGAPVTDQADTLSWRLERIERGMNATPLEVSESHGNPGVYEAAVVFTEPGEYRIHVNGTVEGTHIHTHFEKEVIDRETLAYPDPDGGREWSVRSHEPKRSLCR